MSQYHLLIGTYTSGSSDGIHHYQLDCAPFACRDAALTAADSPSYLALSPCGDFVYAAHEMGADREGWVSSYRLNSDTGELRWVSAVPVKGSDPCHVHPSPDGRYLYVSNYSSGSLTILPRSNSGHLAAPLMVVSYGGGSGAVPSRQVGAHVHFATTVPDGRYLVVCDLGNDCLYCYPLQPGCESRPLALDRVKRVALPHGSGPRQVKFSPCGHFAYVMGELDGCVYLFDYDDGRFTLKQSTVLAEVWEQEAHGGGELALSPDGRFLYASNRGDFNEIVVFALQAKAGRMARIQRIPTLGVMPRHFDITPNGRYLLACNQGSGSLQLFDRDEVNGMLSHMQECVFVDQPACALLLPRC